MATSKEQAGREFRRTLKWIALIGVVMVIGALIFLDQMDAWSFHAVLATVLGVFFSVLLSCGLFALAFFSDKSGHDADVTDATSRRDDR